MSAVPPKGYLTNSFAAIFDLMSDGEARSKNEMGDLLKKKGYVPSTIIVNLGKMVKDGTLAPIATAIGEPKKYKLVNKAVRPDDKPWYIPRDSATRAKISRTAKKAEKGIAKRKKATTKKPPELETIPKIPDLVKHRGEAHLQIIGESVTYINVKDVKLVYEVLHALRSVK